MKTLNAFTLQVINLVKKIPKGKIASYGQIAKLTDKPNASRGVSWVLYTCSKSYNLPWHRVINSKGKISFPKGTINYKKQKNYLQSEGVYFVDEQLDMKKYQWKKKKQKTINSRSTKPKMFAG